MRCSVTEHSRTARGGYGGGGVFYFKLINKTSWQEHCFCKYRVLWSLHYAQIRPWNWFGFTIKYCIYCGCVCLWNVRVSRTSTYIPCALQWIIPRCMWINRDTCAPFVMLDMYMPVVPGCTFVVRGKYVKLFIG